jgi:hypothetical protein
MSDQLGLVFLVLFVFAASACIYLSITMSRRVQAGINRWRNEERQALETQLRQLANVDAHTQIERCTNTNRKSDWTPYNAVQLLLEAK